MASGRTCLGGGGESEREREEEGERKRVGGREGQVGLQCSAPVPPLCLH